MIDGIKILALNKMRTPTSPLEGCEIRMLINTNANYYYNDSDKY